MSLPTLLQKGHIIPAKGEKQKDVDELRGIDYIVDWFDTRLPPEEGLEPYNKANDVGDKVMVLESGTGSGKSTTIPPALYKKYRERTYKTVLCTQPRTLTAQEIPVEILKYDKELQMGKNIGFQTGVFTRRPMKSGILYATIGILTQHLKTLTDDEFCKKYSFVIIDEVHERDQTLDIAIYMMKEFLLRNYKKPDCPFLILMSATFDIDKMAEYFETKNIRRIGGQSHPIEVHYPKYDVNNIIDESVRIALELHKNGKDDEPNMGDILIFADTGANIRETLTALEEANSKLPNNSKLYITELTSDKYKESGKEYEAILAPLDELRTADGHKPARKVFIATNIAETGVTISTLKYVIDPGYVFSVEYNPSINSTINIQKPVTQSMAKQRKGRVGRKFPGEWYPLYTEDTFNKMLVDQHPKIVMEDTWESLLSIICQLDTQGESTTLKYSVQNISNDSNNNSENNSNSNMENVEESGEENRKSKTTKIYGEHFDINKINLLDLPPADAIHSAMEKLFVLGAIDGMSRPTPMGKILNGFRKISIESARMIISGYYYDVSITDLITIAVMLDGRWKGDFTAYGDAKENGWFSGFNKRNKARRYDYIRSRRLFSSDFIEGLLVYNEFINQLGKVKDIEAWCDEVGINFAQLSSKAKGREELIQNMINIGLNPYKGVKLIDTPDDQLLDMIKKIKNCIYEGYRMNLAEYVKSQHGYMLKRRHLILPVQSITTSEYPLGFVEPNPAKFVVVDSVNIKKDRMGNTYSVKANSYCVMDGYVEIDDTF